MECHPGGSTLSWEWSHSPARFFASSAFNDFARIPWGRYFPKPLRKKSEFLHKLLFETSGSGPIFQGALWVVPLENMLNLVFVWKTICAGSSSGPSATVAVGIQFDALQKGYAWQMALLMLQVTMWMDDFRWVC